MPDLPPDPAAEARLRDFLAAELSRAETDFQRIPRVRPAAKGRPATGVVLAVVGALVLIGVFAGFRVQAPLDGAPIATQTGHAGLPASSASPSPAATSSDAAQIVVDCGGINAAACQRAIALARAADTGELLGTSRIVVADVCPRQVLCDRKYPFDSIVVFVTAGADTTGWISFEVTGLESDKPTEARRFGGDLPSHIVDLLTADPPAAWRRLAPAPISGRTGHSAVWTGSEMLVWGGNAWAPDQTAFVDVSDGAAYDPTSDGWRRIAPSPLGGRSDHAAVWTGQVMLIWGGGQGDGGGAFGDGASYDPATDTWRRLAQSPLPPTVDPVAVWTGSQAIFMDRLSGATARYDPGSDTWESLPAPPLPAGWRTATMTPDGVFVAAFGEGHDVPIEAAILDPVHGTWSNVSGSPKSARRMTAALDAGTSVLMMSANDQLLPSGLTPSAGYDVASGHWRELGCGVPTSDAAWTGELVISALGLYDPSTDTCIDIPEPPAREGGSGTSIRESSSDVWTGSELLIWSGSTGGDGAPIPADGVGLKVGP